MTYDYNNETGILTYEVTPKENDQMRLAMLPPGTAEPGATALHIIEHKRKEMLKAFGRCEVRVIVSNAKGERMPRSAKKRQRLQPVRTRAPRHSLDRLVMRRGRNGGKRCEHGRTEYERCWQCDDAA
jgi:hypothetical protein